MATTIKQIRAAGGDYASWGAWFADRVDGVNLVAATAKEVGEGYLNSVETFTPGVGSTMNTTYKAVMSGGKWDGDNFVDKGYKPLGKLFGGATLYGVLTSSGTNLHLEIQDLEIITNSTCVNFFAGVGSLQLRRVILRSGSAGNGAYFSGSGTVVGQNMLVYKPIDGITNRSGVRSDNSASTWKHVIAYGGSNGFNRHASGSAMTFQSCYAVANSEAGFLDDVAAPIDNGGNTSEDGTLVSAGLSAVTEAQYARRVRRNPLMRAYWDGKEAAGEVLGKLGRAAYYRHSGDILGVLGGDAAIAGGLLTGTTGGLTFAEALVTDLNDVWIIVRATIPDSPGSLGLACSKASGDNKNRTQLWVNGGSLALSLWDNAASATAVCSYVLTGAHTGSEHTFALRLSGGVGYLYIDDLTTPVASNGYGGVRDDTDSHEFQVGRALSTYLGAGASMRAAYMGATTAAPVLPLPAYADNQGALDHFERSDFTSQIIRDGGVLAGAPAKDIVGRPIAIKAGIGCFSGQRSMAAAT